MSESIPARFTLRALPLPAKLVLTAFLLTVGLGYTSAMVQLHMQHSERDGSTLPSPANVVAVFAGKVWKEGGDAKLVSRLERMLSGDKDGGLTSANMAPAFFAEDEADFRKIARDPAKLPQLIADRDGERRAVIAWVNAAPEGRRKAYDDDTFVLPSDLRRQPLSPAYTDKANPGTVKVRSVLRDRCVRCHKPGGDKGDVPLTTYEELAKFMPAAVTLPMGDGYVDSGKQMSLEKLTQSTHAHLLSFAVLFGLTGLTFAFTSYPGIVRGLLGPLVLVAQVADVSFWWLARLPDSGPYFAMSIIATGGMVGLGLGAQIVLSLFDMYGRRGKAVIAAVFVFGAALGGAAFLYSVKPFLDAEREKVAARNDADKKLSEDRKLTKEAKPDIIPPGVLTGPSRLEVLLTGSRKDGAWPKAGVVPDGGMVLAFFDKDTTFKDAVKDQDPELPALIAQREGELAAVRAWARLDPDRRKMAYDGDNFALPPEFAGQPLTPEFKVADNALRVRSLLEARCLSCHGGETKVPLDAYEKLDKYLQPTARAATDAIPAAR